MESITYMNLSITGFPFQKINQLVIFHTVNAHAGASIVGELDSEVAQESVARTDETTAVTITTDAKGQSSKLFCGYVTDLQLKNRAGYCRVEMQLTSASHRLDRKKKNKSFQNPSYTYGQVLEKIMGKQADLHMMVTDKAVGGLAVQYNETDWDFARRMVSQLKAPIVTNLTSVSPQIYIGMPPASRVREMKGESFDTGSDIGGYMTNCSYSTDTMLQDYKEEKIKSYEYAYLGDTVIFNGKKMRIKQVYGELTGGILEMSYNLLLSKKGYSQKSNTQGSVEKLGLATIVTAQTDASAASTPASDAAISRSGAAISSSGADMESFEQAALPPGIKAGSSGKIVRGVVKGIVGSNLKVHFKDLDGDGYDEGGIWTFPYATPFSSKDGAGWYGMPGINEEVLVYFPAGKEGSAFAMSSTFSLPLPGAATSKSWRGPNGKSVEMTEEGIFITCTKGSIYINLTQNDGIVIQSDRQFQVKSDKKVVVSGSDILIYADHKIKIGTEKAYLELKEDQATLAGAAVLINEAIPEAAVPKAVIPKTATEGGSGGMGVVCTEAF